LILDDILHYKRTEELPRRKRKQAEAMLRAQATLASPPLDFAAALARPGVSLIAEIKRASPSRGLLRPRFDVAELAQTYVGNGAAAISVLTDARFFQGRPDYLVTARAAMQGLGQNVPILRKDFIIDPYQVYEARALGADALLLIVAVLSDRQLRDLLSLTHRLGMQALVEVHNEAELERALVVEPRIIGINNRELATFRVDLETTFRLRPHVPADVVVVSESGIHTRADVQRLADAGVDAILVGTALVRATDVGAKVRELAAPA
jgi:indole-3-glycerol phosphate synthase